MIYRYGGEAGQFTEHTLYAAGNVGIAAYNFNNLGVKAVAKRAAKDTGKALVQEHSKGRGSFLPYPIRHECIGSEQDARHECIAPEPGVRHECIAAQRSTKH